MIKRYSVHSILLPFDEFFPIFHGLSNIFLLVHFLPMFHIKVVKTCIHNTENLNQNFITPNMR